MRRSLGWFAASIAAIAWAAFASTALASGPPVGGGGATGTFTAISAGAHATCGVKTNGKIVCWGAT